MSMSMSNGGGMGKGPPGGGGAPSTGGHAGSGPQGMGSIPSSGSESVYDPIAAMIAPPSYRMPNAGPPAGGGGNSQAMPPIAKVNINMWKAPPKPAAAPAAPVDEGGS
jgi:hypothetical protein